MPAFCPLWASAKVKQAPSATKNCPVNNSALLEAIADRLQVGAEEFDECAVELLVKLRPVQTRRVLADDRQLLGTFRRADRQEREVLCMLHFRECVRRFERRVHRLYGLRLYAVAALLRGP